MATGIRRDWLHRVVNACQVFAGHAVLRRAHSLRSLFADFETQLPPPQSLIENVVLRGLLLNAQTIRLRRRWPSGATALRTRPARFENGPMPTSRTWNAYTRVTAPTNFAGISMQISHSRYRFEGLHGNAAFQSAAFSAISRN